MCVHVSFKILNDLCGLIFSKFSSSVLGALLSGSSELCPLNLPLVSSGFCSLSLLSRLCLLCVLCPLCSSGLCTLALFPLRPLFPSGLCPLCSSTGLCHLLFPLRPLVPSGLCPLCSSTGLCPLTHLLFSLRPLVLSTQGQRDCALCRGSLFGLLSRALLCSLLPLFPFVLLFSLGSALSQFPSVLVHLLTCTLSPLRQSVVGLSGRESPCVGAW